MEMANALYPMASSANIKVQKAIPTETLIAPGFSRTTKEKVVVAATIANPTRATSTLCCKEWPPHALSPRVPRVGEDDRSVANATLCKGGDGLEEGYIFGLAAPPPPRTPHKTYLKLLAATNGFINWAEPMVCDVCQRRWLRLNDCELAQG